MPETSIVGPNGDVRVSRIGVASATFKHTFSAIIDFENHADFVPPDAPNFCTLGAENGYNVKTTVFVNGSEVNSETACVMSGTKASAPERVGITVPFGVSEGVHTVRFVFDHAGGQNIGEASFDVEKVPQLRDGTWETIAEDEHHETGDIVEVGATLEAPNVPFRDLLMNFAADLLTLQTKVNSELPGKEEITVLDAEIEEQSGGTYDYRLWYRVDHASPIAASTVLAILGVAIIAASIAFSAYQVRKMTETPGGRQAVNGALVLGGGYVAFKILQEMNKRNADSH